jgi:hypothetical protein
MNATPSQRQVVWRIVLPTATKKPQLDWDILPGNGEGKIKSPPQIPVKRAANGPGLKVPVKNLPRGIMPAEMPRRGGMRAFTRSTRDRTESIE